MRKYFFLLSALLCNVHFLNAQYHDFGFEKSFNILVKNTTNEILDFAWVGGLNSCQFAVIDLDFDNVKDMVVFDRIGNRLLTFINNGTANQIDYQYAPEYEKFFPYIHDWLFLVDYNNDGKEDIFTYFTGGMSVYRNDSDPQNGIIFTKIINVLNSLQYSNYLNLYVSEVELPAIADVNGDGCPDILVFHILGSYLNLHTNMSFIKYGHCDSLDFERTHHCWGNFFESENSADLTLNITCPFSKQDDNKNDKDILHVGSTLLAMDLNNNGLKDLLIGDTDFPNLIAAYNDGTLQEAQITSTNINFPSNTTPLQLFSMPLPSNIDVDNDGKKDILVSPYDANPLLTESKKSIWFYKNTGTLSEPVFEFQKKNFFQDMMIEVGTGAYPVFYNLYGGTGIKDLFVSNYGYRDTSYYENGFLYSTFISNIAHYANQGTALNPEFVLQTEDFAGIASMQLKAVYPTFGDVDGDGDTDMIIGEDNGTLHFFENIAGSGNPITFNAPVSNYQGIDVGRYSTPQLLDLNKDSLIDLVIGNRIGRLYYYQNTGSVNNPLFTLITDTLGGVDIKDIYLSNYGYSVPCFFKDSLGNFKLFVGSESGKIYYYDNIDNNLSGNFTLKEEQLLLIYEGTRTAVSVADINNDNFIDMIVGNFSGGLNLFMGKEPEPFSVRENEREHISFTLYPNPAKDIINISSKEVINEKDYQIDIFNITGKKLMSLGFETQLNMSALTKGIYILRITQLSTAKTTNLKMVLY